MRIGAVLADARWRAHLTVDEVSSRTKIREAVIWGIEQDDFSVCSGDAYARGHIRAIAQAVGIDADPLIRQYDETYRTARDTDTKVAPPPPPPPSPGHEPQPTRRRRLAAAASLAVVVLGLVGWAIYHVASGVGASSSHQAVAAAGHASHASGVAAAAGQGSHQPSAVPSTPSSPSAAPPPSASPTPTPSPTHAATPPSKDLALASLETFGPGGAGTGDNPQTADAAINSSAGSAWHSHWYASPAFGNLKDGTGLLIDLGRRVTITDAQLNLGSYSGADVQLKAATSADLSGLHVIGSAKNAGGTVRLNFSAPTRARYVVIWFTQLPPDGNGTYQAAVSNVIIRGHS